MYNLFLICLLTVEFWLTHKENVPKFKSQSFVSWQLWIRQQPRVTTQKGFRLFIYHPSTKKVRYAFEDFPFSIKRSVRHIDREPSRKKTFIVAENNNKLHLFQAQSDTHQGSRCSLWSEATQGVYVGSRKKSNQILGRK
jgi:hypothetical protein